MEIGNYIRTSSGKIAKYLGHERDIYKFDKYIYWFYEYYNDYVYDDDYEEWLEEEEVKVYKNLIDLIQVGDYVNGCYVEGFIEKNKFQNKLIITEAGMIDNNDIKSIVTKECFESIEYKVKE